MSDEMKDQVIAESTDSEITKLDESIQKLKHSNIKTDPLDPLKLVYHPIRRTEDDQMIGRFTEIIMNDPLLGVVTPISYRPIANNSELSEKLSEWGLAKILDVLSNPNQKRNDYFVTAYVPSRMIKDGTMQRMFERQYQREPECLKRLVIELSTEALYEEAEWLSPYMRRIKSEYGCKFMLSEYGDEYSPLLRINKFPFDYVMTDQLINTDYKLRKAPIAEMKQIVEKDTSRSIIFGALNGEKFKDKIKELEIPYYLGYSRRLPARRLSSYEY